MRSRHADAGLKCSTLHLLIPGYRHAEFAPSRSLARQFGREIRQRDGYDTAVRATRQVIADRSSRQAFGPLLARISVSARRDVPRPCKSRRLRSATPSSSLTASSARSGGRRPPSRRSIDVLSLRADFRWPCRSREQIQRCSASSISASRAAGPSTLPLRKILAALPLDIRSGRAADLARAGRTRRATGQDP